MTRNKIIREYQSRDLWRCTFIVWRALGFKCAKAAYKDFKNPDYRSGSFEKLFVYMIGNGTPVGVCGLYAPPEFPKGTVSLHWTAVRPLFQHAGVGSYLLAHVERVAVSFGFTNLVVECDGMLNRYAHNFYRKKGFKLSDKKMWKEWQEWPQQCDVLEKSLPVVKG